MGRATIIAHKGAGLYDVALTFDRSAYDRRVAALTASLATAASQLSTLAEKITTAGAERSASLAALDAAIAGKDAAAIRAAERRLLTAAATLEGLTRTRAEITARRTADAIALETLQAAPPDDQAAEAWCADYSEDLSGTVGTIDPLGAGGRAILRPGYNGDAAYTPGRDGHFRKRGHMGPAELFFNAAILPGWQKWMAPPRIGTITALNGDSCDVLLEAAESDAQGLDTNQSPALTGVGVSYMECNGAAFEVGDTVVVAFAGSWENPQVIGFEKNPRPCAGTYGLRINDNGRGMLLAYFNAVGWQPFNVSSYEGTFEEILLATNAARAANGGLRPFVRSLKGMINPAQLICDIIRDTGIAYIEGYLPHESAHYPAGSQTVAKRIDNNLADVSSFAENLLAVPKVDPGTGAPLPEKSGAELVDLWMDSPGHRANILGTEIPEFQTDQTFLFVGRAEDANYRYYAQVMCTIRASLVVGGTVDWRGLKGRCLSWRGLPSRYYMGRIGSIVLDPDHPTVAVGDVRAITGTYSTGGLVVAHNKGEFPTTEDYYGGNIFKGEEVLAVGGGGHVCGCAIQGGKIVFVVGYQMFLATDRLYTCDLDGSNVELLGVVASYDEWDPWYDPAQPEATNLFYAKAPTQWLFNASGTRAIARKLVYDWDGHYHRAHKLVLTVDAAAKTYSVVDEGPCTELVAGEFAELKIFDWDGDTEVVGTFRVDETTSSVQTGYNQWELSSAGTYSFAIDGEVKIEQDYAFSGLFGTAGYDGYMFNDFISNVVVDLRTRTLIERENIVFAGLLTSRDSYRINYPEGYNRRAGELTSDVKSGKKAHCVQGGHTVGQDGYWVWDYQTGLEDGRLEDFSTIPCNPICAV